MGFDKEKFKEAGKKFLGITGHEAPEDPAPQKTEEEIKEIDEGFKTLEELEAEEEAERKKLEAEKKHHVIITGDQGNKARIARVIAAATGESLEKASKKLDHFPVDIAFSTKSEAVKFAKEVTNAGGKATIKTS